MNMREPRASAERRRLCALVLGALVAAALGRPAQASTVHALSLQEMTRRADVIAVTVAREAQARREHNGALIVTDVALEVETALKGVKAGERIVATVLGGVLDGLALQVPGEANFTVGQRSIVFLTRTPDGAELRVVGMSQGVLPISTLGPQPVVRPGGQGAALVEPGADGQLHDAPAALLEPQPLADLVGRIRALVAAGSPATRRSPSKP